MYSALPPAKTGTGSWKAPAAPNTLKCYRIRPLCILDQEFNDPVEGSWLVPCRVVAGSEGAHFLMTFTKPAVMPDEPFYKAVELIEQEMGKLKEVLENS
jgi:hypothetical protein